MIVYNIYFKLQIPGRSEYRYEAFFEKCPDVVADYDDRNIHPSA
jgi:hypothetical protein